MAPQAVLETLLQAHLALEQNPAAAIAHLANSYGIDWKSVGLDPRLEAQRQGQLHQARQQAAMLQQQHQQWQSQRQQYLQKEIESLITGKEHWSEIENETMVQLNAMRQQNPRLAEADLELYVERSSL
jgi:hypothetical protein